MKILIVDDHAGLRQVVADFLRDPRLHIFECNSGEAAIDAYAKHLPDWVTMDIEMPGIGGFGAARAITKTHPNARIIFLTLYDNENLRLMAKEAGGCAYVLKDSLAALKEILQASETV